MTEGETRPRKGAVPQRKEYGAWRTATTRWADDDVYGHMNNARYFELIDTAVNAYLAEACGVNIRSLPAVGLVAEVSCRYFREVGYPAPIDLGLAIERIGTSSVVYRIGIFQSGSGLPDEEAAAEGRFVHVYVTAAPDRAGVGAEVSGPRSSTPIPDLIRRAVEALLPESHPDQE